MSIYLSVSPSVQNTDQRQRLSFNVIYVNIVLLAVDMLLYLRIVELKKAAIKHILLIELVLKWTYYSKRV